MLRSAVVVLMLTITATVGAGCADVVQEDEDRRYPAWIVGVDVTRRTVTIDEIEWLSGEEAARAWRRDNPAEAAAGEVGPPNDYYIVDDDELRRTLPVATDVDVALVRLAEDGDADLDPGTFEELPAYSRRSSGSVFWLTVRSGTVVRVQEQYRP